MPNGTYERIKKIYDTLPLKDKPTHPRRKRYLILFIAPTGVVYVLMRHNWSVADNFLNFHSAQQHSITNLLWIAPMVQWCPMLQWCLVFQCSKAQFSHIRVNPRPQTSLLNMWVLCLKRDWGSLQRVILLYVHTNLCKHQCRWNMAGFLLETVVSLSA